MRHYNWRHDDIWSDEFAGPSEDDWNKLEHTEAAGHVRSGVSAGVGSGKCAGLSEDV